MVLLAALALGLAGLLVVPAAQACPWCGESLPNSQAKDGSMLSRPDSPNVQSSLAEGFYYSILLMVCVPYLVLGGIGFYLWRMYQVNTQARQEQEELEPLPTELQGVT
jgi:hypothetical protein